MRMHHTAIVTADLERSIAFYCGPFGFRLQERGEFEGTPLAFLAIDGGLLELIQGKDPLSLEGVVNHIALAVADLPAEMERLRAAGVRFLDETPVPIYSGGQIAFCEGPDGEQIELIQLPPAGTVRAKSM